MRTILILGALMLLTSPASADTWNGLLLDRNCVQSHRELRKYQLCSPTPATTSFDLQVSGRILHLDPDGNRKAAAVWKEYIKRVGHPPDPDLREDPVTVLVEGAVNGDELKVESISLP